MAYSFSGVMENEYGRLNVSHRAAMMFDFVH